jgi:uncharacterized cupin superfamily protein
VSALTEDAAALELAPAPIDPAQVVEGDPRVGLRELWTSPDGGVSVGVWEITPGVVRDVEQDEVFTVLFGRATVTFAERPALELGPGSVAVLRAGEETLWRVHETLRKVYTLWNDVERAN